MLSEQAFRRLFGVDIPDAPPFGHVLVQYWLPVLSRLPGTSTRLPSSRVYQYTCLDSRFRDFTYTFTYDSGYEDLVLELLLNFQRSVAFEMLLSWLCSLGCIFILNANTRETIIGEARRLFFRQKRELFRFLVGPPRQVTRIPVEHGDLCALCMEELLPDDGRENDGSVSFCRWGCGKAIHTACQQQAQEQWRDSCVYCGSSWS